MKCVCFFNKDILVNSLRFSLYIWFLIGVIVIKNNIKKVLKFRWLFFYLIRLNLYLIWLIVNGSGGIRLLIVFFILYK